jgi:hypothetical protein
MHFATQSSLIFAPGLLTPEETPLLDGFPRLDVTPARTYLARAQRWAVLGSVFPWDVYKTRDWPALYGELHRRWTLRLQDLRDAHWDYLRVFPHKNEPGKSRLIAMSACPPFGVEFEKPSYTCQRSKLCPFCWARNITGSVYDRLQELLVERVRPMVLTVLTRHLWVRSSPAALREFIDILQAFRHKERKAYADTLGGFVLHKLMFAPKYDHLHRLTMHIQDGDEPEDPDLGEYQDHSEDLKVSKPKRAERDCIEWKHFVVRRKQDLVPAVAFFTKYPYGLLDCDPHRLVDYLHNSKNFRTFSSFGCLYARD